MAESTTVDLTQSLNDTLKHDEHAYAHDISSNFPHVDHETQSAKDAIIRYLFVTHTMYPQVLAQHIAVQRVHMTEKEKFSRLIHFLDKQKQKAQVQYELSKDKISPEQHKRIQDECAPKVAICMAQYERQQELAYKEAAEFWAFHQERRKSLKNQVIQKLQTFLSSQDWKVSIRKPDQTEPAQSHLSPQSGVRGKRRQRHRNERNQRKQKK
eukprot:Clim_evm34s143 gene=Clim_evmTU34s143